MSRMQSSTVLQTITDHVGITNEAFSGVATILVTKTGKYCFICYLNVLCTAILCYVFVSK